MENKMLFKELRDYLMIAIGMISYGMGWTLFLLPNHITSSGVPGIASVLYWGTGIPPQTSYFVINAILLLIALKILGWKFCIKTIFAVIILTFYTSFFSTTAASQHLLADQPFMAALIGAIFCGSGIGLALSYNGSSGGTDIVAAIINKYRDISLGRIIMIIDIIIISSSYLVLHNWEKVIYGYVVLCVSSFCVDQVFESRRKNVQFFIISKKYKEIASRIAVYPHRGATVIEAHGFYTGRDVKMLFIMAKRREKNIIFNLINEIDPNAFVTESNVQAVVGEGFDQFKVHNKSQNPKKESKE
ncbi:YitT family protein [Segatella bryantii]|uniref:YitT family protein n=1 Tax=Segatella bryantii TaxID=77095 RepID=UPI001EDBBFE6|nr:YitT family protein [Segatella bryantii]UKK73681.1 YitT family protein [Segatella bryantii]